MIIESTSEVRVFLLSLVIHMEPELISYKHSLGARSLPVQPSSFFFFPSSLEHVSIECHKPNSSIHDSQAEERKMSQGAEENSK